MYKYVFAMLSNEVSLILCNKIIATYIYIYIIDVYKTNF